jgi:hypothetical protein
MVREELPKQQRGISGGEQAILFTPAAELDIELYKTISSQLYSTKQTSLQVLERGQ